MIEQISDKNKWDELVNQFSDKDFYHSFDYHELQQEEGSPVLLKYMEDNTIIALPLLIRPIPNTDFFDATSVYGYPGPLGLNISRSFNNNNFRKELFEYFESINVISVFSRLNPFISSQKIILNMMGSISSNGPVVFIDLTKTLDQQLKSYQKRVRGQINKARRHCSVIEATNESQFEEFISIYHENMDRVNANSEYYFSDSYYKKIVNSSSFETQILLAIDEESGETMAGSMFISLDNCVHYHLSGTRTAYLPMMPTKLLIDEMRIRATNSNKKFVNLGGGLGGKVDSLFNFKSSFSKDFKDFCIWKLIVNKEAYQQLSSNRNKTIKTSFFPEYRFNENQKT